MFKKILIIANKIHFISSLHETEKANIAGKVSVRLSQINMTAVSVICNEPSTNFTMFKKFERGFGKVHNLKRFTTTLLIISN